MSPSINHLLDTLNQFARSRRGKILSGLCLGLLIILSLLPHLISYGVRDWLQEHGADNVKIEDVDFNLFSGRLEFNNMHITVTEDYTLVLSESFINIDWLPLFRKKFHIKEVYVENTNINLEQRTDGKLLIAGISTTSSTRPKAAKKNKPWDIGLDKLTVLNTTLRYKQSQLDISLHIDSASLTELQSDKKTAAHFILAGKLNGSSLHIDSQLTPFAARAGFDASIKLAALELAGLKPLAKNHLKTLAGELSFNGRLKGSYHTGSGVQIDNSGMLALHDLDISDDNFHIKTGEFNWTGSIQTGPQQEDNVLPLNIKGGLTAGTIIVRDVQAADDTAALMNFDVVKIPELKFENNNLHLSSIDIQQLQTSLLRNTEGKLSFIERFTASTNKPANSPALKADVTKQDQAVMIRIDEIKIGKNSSVAFEDRSTQPAFKSVVHLDSIKLGQLDSSKPEQATHLAINGKIGKFSSLVSEASLYPFLPQPGLKMTAVLKAVELPPLTSYTSGILGYKLINGQLQADIKVNIQNNKLDGESKLVLNNLDVLALTAEEKKAINTSADMSLELGLAMLRDKQNNIKLSLPFKGDLNDPQFDISDAINQAIGKAITTTGMSFLKLALQPFGAILMVAEIANNTAGAVQLQPVAFAAGNTEMDANALQYQQRLASLLHERPQLRIKICGVATSSDRDYLATQAHTSLMAKQAARKNKKDRKKPIPLPTIGDEQLLELAALRADAVKDVLINRHKISADRLFSCHSKIKTDAEATPAVELGI